MNIKTITTVDGVNVVNFGSAASRFYWIENLGSTTVYVSGNENIVPDGDNVKVLSAGCGTMIENLGGKVYILGAGKFQITNQGDKFPPFRNAPVADGGVMASGNPVQIDGLQGGVPFSEITVSGKNLIPSDYMTKSGTYNGVTVTVKNDGRFDVNGTPTKSFTVLSFTPSKYYLKGGKKYTFNCSHIYNVNTFNIIVRVFNKYGEQIKGILSYPTTITANDGDYFVWGLWAVENYEISATDVEVQLEYGDTATEYEPPITGRELQVNVCGKNLMKPNKSTVTLNGITATMNDDGSVTLNGTATANTYIFMWNILYAHNMGVGKIAVNAIDGQSISTYFMGIDRREGSSYIDRVAQSITNNGIGEITQEDVENERNFTVWVRVAEGYTCNNLIIYPQLEIGSTATPYEPYHGAEYTITPNSNPYVIPNDIRQQDGLNVVSVSEGEISVTGVRKNAAVKKIWDKIDELTTAIIVSNGETIE